MTRQQEINQASLRTGIKAMWRDAGIPQEQITDEAVDRMLCIREVVIERSRECVRRCDTLKV